MDKMWQIYIMEYYKAIKKNDTLIHVTRMNLKNTMLSERSQSQRVHVDAMPRIDKFIEIED